MNDENPLIDPEELRLANLKHDQEHGSHWASIRSAWNGAALIRRGRLTDAKIGKYEKMGWYAPEAVKARSEARRRAAVARKGIRRGSYVEIGGRLIYAPE